MSAVGGFRHPGICFSSTLITGQVVDTVYGAFY